MFTISSLSRRIFGLVLCVGCATNAFSFSLKSLSPHAWLDNKYKKQFGEQEVSDWYKNMTVEFLGYLGVEHADAVPVRQLVVSSQALIDAKINLVPGLAVLTGIWLNEPALEKFTEEDRLWYIAHEAAHYRLNHAQKHFIAKEVATMFPAVCILLDVGVASALVNFLANRLDHVKNHQTLYGSISFLAASMLSSRAVINNFNQFLLPVIFAYKKKNEREADLAAASMLCDNEYAYVVKKHIEALNKSIDAGMISLNSFDHPTFVETRDYLQTFWNAWLLENPEFKLETQSCCNSCDTSSCDSICDGADSAETDVIDE